MRLEVRNAEFRDLPEIKRQIDEYLAVDYYSMETLEACLKDARTLFYVVTDADAGDRIVSYFYAYVVPLREALGSLHAPEKPEALKGYGDETLVGVYKTSSTVKEYQGRGICTSFIRDLEPVLRRRGAKLILATAMRSPEGAVPMRRIFRAHGYDEIAELIRPWHEQYLYCPYCGRHHCICDAVFYMKKLDETEDVDFDEGT